MAVPRFLMRAAARAKPLVPERAWPALMSLATLTGSRPLVGLPATDRILVLAPHPDDETIGCGGTIARLADRGAEVMVVIVTDGQATKGSPHAASETARRRRQEAGEACRILGVPSPRCLGLPDGAVAAHADDLVAAVDDLAAAVPPDLVLAPWLLDGHPDHRAVLAAVARLRLPTETRVWGFEAHTPLTPTNVADVTPVIERKRAALEAHATAARAFDLEATLGLNRWRSLLTGPGVGWAEAFHATTMGDLPELLELTDGVVSGRCDS